MKVTAKIRYKSKDAAATLTPHNGWAEINFEEPQRAITPGQAVVFYNDDTVIGGGYIETSPTPAPVKTNVHVKIKA